MTTAVLPEHVLAKMPSFLAMIQGGVGPKNAAIACEWTIRQLHELESMPQFQEAMKVAREQLTESIEAKVVELALAGNVPMIQLYLYCQAQDRGWRPPATRVAVQHQGVVQVQAVMATKAALKEIMMEQGPDALAYGGPLDAIEAASEVVDDAPTD